MNKKLISILNITKTPIIKPTEFVQNMIKTILESPLPPSELRPLMIRSFAQKVNTEIPLSLRTFNQFLYYVQLNHPEIYKNIAPKIFGNQPVRRDILNNYPEIRKLYVITRHNPGPDALICANLITVLGQANKALQVKTSYTGSILPQSKGIMDELYGQGFTDGAFAYKQDYNIAAKHIMQPVQNFKQINGNKTLLDALKELKETRYEQLFVTDDSGNYLGRISADDIPKDRNFRIKLSDYLENCKKELKQHDLDPDRRNFLSDKFVTVDRYDTIDAAMLEEIKTLGIIPVTQNAMELAGNITANSINNAIEDPTIGLIYVGTNENIYYAQNVFPKPFAKISTHEDHSLSRSGVPASPLIIKEAASLTSLYLTEFSKTSLPLAPNDIKAALTAVYLASDGFTRLFEQDKHALNILVGMMYNNETIGRSSYKQCITLIQQDNFDKLADLLPELKEVIELANKYYPK